MSSIFGFVLGEKAKNKQKLELKKMLLWNKVYGTGNEGCYEGPDLSMGCYVENLSDKYIQQKPVPYILGHRGVIDAVVYNRADLVYKCMCDSNISDAELLLLYIIKFGPDALKDVNGDFSGAIYYEKEKKLLVFRDHMGIRPLFYYAENGIVAFSTDIRGLAALPQIDMSVSEEWIYRSISGYDANTIDNTPYRMINCVTPASYIWFSFSKGKIKTQKTFYWRLRQKKIKLSNQRAYQDRLRELITDAVKRRLEIVSGPVGAEMSGGLDSGVIDILINRTGREGIYYSWSLDPKEHKLVENDERLVIEDICRQENITCYYKHKDTDHDKIVRDRMIELGIIPASEESIDFGFAFPTWSNTYILINSARLAAENGAKIIFTGHGGDEGVSHRCSPFEMYLSHEYYQYFRYIWRATKGHRHRIFKTISTSYKHIRGKKKELKQPFINNLASPELLKSDFSKQMSGIKSEAYYFNQDPIKYIVSGGSRNRLDNIAFYGALCKVRFMVPYLDYRVIDFAVSIPRHLYLKGRQDRYIYREAFKDMIPESLYKLNRKDDTSDKNLDSDPNWYEEYSKRKSEIINKLDQEYWKKYLNFEEIEKFAKSGKPTDEEMADEYRRLKCLLNCALAQNLVEKARNITT